MPNPNPEKLASAEIAGSRERFEKAAKPYFNNGESFCPWDEDHYADDIAEGMWQMHLAAERETRERCAQLVEEFRQDVYCDSEIGWVQDEIVNLAQRIRGVSL